MAGVKRQIAERRQDKEGMPKVLPVPIFLTSLDDLRSLCLSMPVSETVVEIIAGEVAPQTVEVNFNESKVRGIFPLTKFSANKKVVRVLQFFAFGGT